MTSDNLEKMDDLPVILFPHTYLPESSAKKILIFFGPLTIFQPWFMEQPGFISGADGRNLVQILNPPNNLKPEEGFKTLLSEYHHWIDDNQDKSYQEFLKASQGKIFTENTTWEIRQMLRQINKGASTAEEGNTLKWHLILHLAREVEDQRREAERVLGILKEKASPLKGIIEEDDDLRSLFEDLPPFGSELPGGGYQLGEIFEAWFALFGGYLKGNELLITLNRSVIDYVAEHLDEVMRGEGSSTERFRIEFTLPDMPHHSLESISKEEGQDLMSKNIRELRRLLIQLDKNPEYHLSSLRGLSKEMDRSFPRELTEKRCKIRIQYLPSSPELGNPENDRLLSSLTHKTIILMEDGWD